MTNTKPEPQPLRLTVEEAARSLRVSRAYFYKMIAAGQLRTHHEGRRRFVSVTELQRYVAQRDAAAA